MNKFAARLQAYRENVKANGFSMLEAVVVVGVLLALAVAGFIAYGQITDNAKKAAVESAASSVYTAAAASEMDGDPATTLTTVADDYNNSQSAIKVAITGTGKTLKVVATNNDSPAKTATAGVATTPAP